VTNSLDRVVIAVLTFRRPRQLEELLPALLEQAEEVPNPVEVLVVDNDPDSGALSVTQSAVGTERIRYVHEMAPGIASARNRALDEAGEFELLVFIDDDERPAPGWLAALLDAHRTHSPSAVTGPVLSRYEVEPGEWIRAGRFFERARHVSGTRVPMAPTSNLLLDLRAVRALAVRFDERFGLSGGSDSLFTRQLSQRGGTIVWCDDAVVIDLVPATRLTREWVLQRSFRFGNAASRLHLENRTSIHRVGMRVALFGVGLYRVVMGFIRFLAGVLTGHLGHNARGLRTAARGAGMLTGSFGSVYREYRRG
jgi:succinoglycan biosynthesis protein ExoM